MSIVACVYCGTNFYRKPSQVILAKKHYCSNICRFRGRKNGKTLACFVCGKETYKSLKDLRRSKSKKYFCSTFCGNKWLGKERLGDRHPNWTTGKSSYKTNLKRQSIIQMCTLCATKDVRILAVHHIDKNHENNNVRNLMWLCHNCHFLVHHYPQENKKNITHGDC